MLDFIYEGQADDILEACGKTVTALGPGAVEAIGERLGQDYVYDIYAGSALANIPTSASVEIFLSYLRSLPERVTLAGLCRCCGCCPLPLVTLLLL